MTCAPVVPLNSCSVVWKLEGTGPQQRLVGYTRLAQRGGLTELCDDELNTGLAVRLLGDPECEGPVGASTESRLRLTCEGELYFRQVPRKKRAIPAVVSTGITAGTTELLSTTIDIDTTGFQFPTCWEICLDICTAVLDSPQGEIVDQISSGQMIFNIDGHACNAFSADRFFGTYSGRICHELLLDGGQVHQIPIGATVVADSTVTIPFTANTGAITAVFEQIECSEFC